ncbi:tRNA uridine-5-carboxymethylaminomethyl(34) synthesis GTPase MnmE [Alphaproteobacteria bacterium]|nr:tRNA uridine-5-carboxymethylaminomethyl(34) synthesis GTPase MnmE [Alphaproteobacteria bacterium]
MDTIFSSATGNFKSAIKIIRISGEKSKTIPDIFFYKHTNPKEASVRKLYDKERNLIDKAIVIYFPGPKTATGEDLYEIHIHGSLIIEKKLYKILNNQKEFRIAEPGEFTKRAFLNGIIDLTQAEGLNDLINSETEEQLKLSTSQYEGKLSNKLNFWRSEIVFLLSKLEALIDFSDEELPSELENIFLEKVSYLLKEMKSSVKESFYGERLRDGFIVTIIGRPNVGKSSLINYLSNKKIAIVTNEPGTTRDILEVMLDFSGYPVFLNDTAGIRESKSKIEKIGIKKAINKAKKSDVVLILSDTCDFIAPELTKNQKIIFVQTKSDLKKKIREDAHQISVKQNIGINELIEKIVNYFISLSPRESVYLTRLRHVDGVKNAIAALDRLNKINLNNNAELVAEELRVAAISIGSITKIIDVEEVLDDIFNSFCIGK